MVEPAWYGKRYPSFGDLERFANELGTPVLVDDFPVAIFLPSGGGGPLIGLPAGRHPIEHHWNLAHELGHLVQHSGPLAPRARSKQEAQANQWAACALIPHARIQFHQNASLDAFIGALSSHYGDLPLENCPERKIAAKIAKIRLQILNKTSS